MPRKAQRQASISLQVLGSSATLRSPNVDAQRAINLRFIPDESKQGKGGTPGYFTSCPGFTQFATTGTIGRGIYATSGGRLLVVADDTLYEISSAGVATARGTLSTSAGAVDMADNGQQVMLVDGTFAYIFTLATNAFDVVTDPDCPASTHVVFVDGYFVLNVDGTGQYMITALYDGSSVDSLDFRTVEGSPDDLISILADHRELWNFGTATVEVHYNSGNADFPFEAVQGAYIEHGCAAAYAPAKLNNTVFWLSNDAAGQGVVYKAEGYQPVRVSTFALEAELATYSTLSDAIGTSYMLDGSRIYQLSFPTEGKTWCYDSLTDLWFQRAYRNTTSGAFEQHKAQKYTFCFGKSLALDRSTGTVWEMSSTVYTDNGDPLVRVRTCPYVAQGTTTLFHNELRLDIETGVGLVTGDGSDPYVEVRWSDDGAHTWSNYISLPIGKIGEFSRRVRAYSLGSSPNGRVYEILYSAPTKFNLIGGEVLVEVGQW